MKVRKIVGTKYATVSILGTDYSIVGSTPKKDKMLKDKFAYTDHSVKKIVFDESCKDITLADKAWYMAKVMRHEIQHAFMVESGLNEYANDGNIFGHDERLIDWYAYQSPKIHKVYEELKIL